MIFSPIHAKNNNTENGPKKNPKTNSLLEAAAGPKIFG